MPLLTPCASIVTSPISAYLALFLILAQALWIYLAHRRSRHREVLFRIITENAADMIALVDTKGRRLYNSPAYQRILGYSPSELAQTSVFEQIHPEDRFKVLEAAREARTTGVGKSLQYRLRHKNGDWRVLESTASTICNDKGEVEKLVIIQPRCNPTRGSGRQTRAQRPARRANRLAQPAPLLGPPAALVRPGATRG